VPALAGTAVLEGTVVVAFGDVAASTPKQLASMPPKEFLALAEKGLEGTFRLTYRVDGTAVMAASLERFAHRCAASANRYDRLAGFGRNMVV